MAPQESNVIIGTKRTSQISDLFQFPFPKKRKKNRKKKSNLPGLNLPNGSPQKLNATIETIEVITLDSDDSHDKFEKSDDDVVVLDKPITKIDLSDDQFETIDACDFNESDFEENNIVLNIVDPIPPPETCVLSSLNSLSSVNHESEQEIYRPRPIPDYPKRWTKEMIDYYTQPCEEYRNFDYKEVLKTIRCEFLHS